VLQKAARGPCVAFCSEQIPEQIPRAYVSRTCFHKVVAETMLGQFGWVVPSSKGVLCMAGRHAVLCCGSKYCLARAVAA